MESFVEGEVVIYEGHMEDILCVFEKSDKDGFVYLNELDGGPFRTTTLDRIRKVSRETLTNRLSELELERETLMEALNLKPGLIGRAGVKWGDTVKTYVRPEDQIPKRVQP